MLRRCWLSALLVMVAAEAVLGQNYAPPPTLPVAAPPAAPPAHNYPPGVVDVTPPESIHHQPPTMSYLERTNCCPPQLPSFLVSVEYLLVRPRRSDLDYAVVDPRNNLVPEGSAAGLEWQTNSGLRVGFTWRPNGGLNDISFTYTYVYSNDDGGVTRPVGGVVYPLLTRPGLIDEVQTATAFSSLNYNVFDIDVGRRIIIDECFNARVFAGSRIADIGQVFEASYDGIDANQAQSRFRSTMSGGGLTFGGEARWLLGNSLSAYGRGRGSLIVADYHTCVRETDFAGNVLLTDASDSFVKVVPVLDLGVGLSYRRRNWHASLGYELTQWFNQSESITFLDDFAEGKRFRRMTDLSLEAITFQVGVEY
jgi:hypothetical protein